MRPISNYFSPPQSSLDNETDISLKNSVQMVKIGDEDGLSGQQIVKNMEMVLLAVKERKKKKHRAKHKKRDITDVTEDSGSATHQEQLKCPKVDEPKDPKCNGKMKNAFQLMMAARTKSIGINGDGKIQNDLAISNNSASKKNARTELLREWANKKGGTKRRAQEKARETYIEEKLHTRKENFKKMLNRSSENETENTIRRSNRKRKPNKQYEEFRRSLKRALSSSSSSSSVEDDSFTAQLNSPLKKKNTLLGFLRKENDDKSPNTETTDSLVPITPSKLDQPKLVVALKSLTKNDVKRNVDEEPTQINKLKNTRRSLKISAPVLELLKTDAKDSENSSDPTQITHDQVENPPDIRLPLKESNVFEKSLRPRRSCTKKVSYEALDDSPELKKKRGHNDELSHGTAKKIKMDVIHVESDDSNDQKIPEKLAPIFNKRFPKPVIDPEVSEARRHFLQSGLPEVMKKDQDDQRCFLESYDVVDQFPVVNHVGHTVIQEVAVNWDMERIKLRPHIEEDHTEKFRNFRLNIDPYEKVNYEPSFEQLNCRKTYKKQLKSLYEKFPVNKAFHQLQVRHDEGLYIDKYRPTSSEQFLVNFMPILALKKFLSAWSEDVSSHPVNGPDDDFDGCSNSSKTSTPSNVILLYGCPGTGKSSSTYALAQEMNFNVLEVNAGSERNGKKMLKDLLEATKSHGAKDSKKLALIVIEDADVIFPEDEGFLGCLNQLIANSKRPIVLIASDKTAVHLQRFSAIEFKSPKTHLIAKWITILTACENYEVDLQDIENLLQSNHGDLRKTLVQVEFYLRSGGDLKERHTKCRDASKENVRRKHKPSIFFEPKNEQLAPRTEPQLDEIAFHLSNAAFTSHLTKNFSDGLIPNINEDISHEIKRLQGFGNQHIYSPKRIYFLYENLENYRLRSQLNFLDVEPALRQICRTEAKRNQSGRKCRFNHYLRDTLHFPPSSFDQFNEYCAILNPQPSCDTKRENDFEAEL